MSETMCTLNDLKVVYTYGSDRKPNGRLIECVKDGKKTLSYITIIAPGCMKGYHLHNERAARYICLRGRVKIKLYSGSAKEEYYLDQYDPKMLTIPPFVATGLFNDCPEEAWILNFPYPPYDPTKYWEQEEYTEEELEKIWKEKQRG